MGADANCTKEELVTALRSSQCKAVITNSSLLSKVTAAAKDCPSVKTIICVRSSKDEVLPEGVAAWEDVIQTHTGHFEKIQSSADDPAFIQYQTGVPESRNGIVMSHKSISTMVKISTE
ncbi:hypothetical protein OESDEN_11996 [Oesophagostomum dentatum]|uniref:Uncharacterized protein n=1 Tax=Oesophagostomum dentatum TaxID=61180 RepID=A0A0B1STE6_OESDE|nr:hypothetical protein OESDEN_11996 [Oesophagostomum dentatum]